MLPPLQVMYDRTTSFWNILYHVLAAFPTTTKMKRMWTQFWGAHQRFYRQMLMAAKVRTRCPCLQSGPVLLTVPMVLLIRCYVIMLHDHQAHCC